MSVFTDRFSQVFHAQKKREFFLFAISFHSTNRICPQPSCQNSRGVGTRWVGRTKGTGKLPSSQSVLNFIYLSTELLHLKEGCNTGHGLSAAIKLGSLEKTVGASLIALWCVQSSPFL